MAELVYDRPYSYYWYTPATFVNRVITTIFGIIEFFIVLRIVLELLGASSSSTFVAWVYGVTDGLIAPFAGAFPNWNLGGFVVDISAIFAIVGYAIIAWLLARLMSFIFAALA